VSHVIPERVRVKLLRPSSRMPQYMSAGAAGADVFADLEHLVPNATAWTSDSASGLRLSRGVEVEGVRAYLCRNWHSGTPVTYRIPLGFAIEIPVGHVGLLKGRSGFAAAGNEAHVAYIDSDYRGEVAMIVHVVAHLTIAHGDRVGQIAIVPAPQYRFDAVDELSSTERGTGGFGSTGK